jgi:hypothetical protein
MKHIDEHSRECDQQALEQALRRALRARPADEAVCDAVLKRLAAQAAPRVPRRARWLPVALAASVLIAGLLAALGLADWRQQRQHERMQARAARTEVLEALRLASGYLASARTTVMQTERPLP